MAHSYLCVRVHYIWSTYRRTPWLSPEWRERLYRYFAAVTRRKGGVLLCAGGVRDHVHLYVSLPPDVSIARLVNALKANSSRWIHESFPKLRSFAWQHGYSAFSVSRFSEAGLIKYIRNQEQHHNEHTFAREITRLAARHGLAPRPERPAHSNGLTHP